MTQQIAVPRRQLPSATMTPSNYATPQASSSGQDTKTHIPVPVSTHKDIKIVDFDSQLDATDFDNLKTLKLAKPSKSNTIAKTLDSIKTHNRAIGPKLGKGPPSKKLTAIEKSEIESQRETLKKYSDILKNTEAGKKLVVSHKSDKTGSGIHEISY